MRLSGCDVAKQPKKSKAEKLIEQPKETPEDLLNKQIVALALSIGGDGPVSHLRVTAMISKAKGKHIEPALVWRALANLSSLKYNRATERFL